ncbi:MAG TPA: HAMP domain-containing protein [Rhodospirillaceae bacterium]|nr:HAMP domain-containing protein [Rhodospirillaceae bacterium]
MSIRTRTILLLLVGLTVSHIGSMLVYSADHPHHDDLTGLILSTLVMVAATLIIGYWATGWITAPLAAFAQAAERLGRDVAAPPLAEDGPAEVLAASKAFNRMQERVNSFVEDRLQMLAAISHDLRTPITRLRLRTEQLPIDALQQGKMLADLDEMEQMVTANLNFARDESSVEASQTVDLAALLQTICDEAADIGREAEFDWQVRLPFGGRPQALKRLFANLVENATRYGERARVSATNHGETMEVVIDDDGPGIPETQLKSVFRPFTRLEQSRNLQTGGIGLGLANARTIARAHGGDVVLENRPGGGLRAIVRLPADHLAKG